MIVYSATKQKFHEDLDLNTIDDVILSKFQEVTGKTVGRSEQMSWKNSMQYMGGILRDPMLPEDLGISIEYHVPQSSKRVDFIITGKNENEQDTVVIIELKQWQKAELTNMDATVRTRFAHGVSEALHPSYQAWSYKRLIEDYNEVVQTENIPLIPCAYLHNYTDDGIITNDFYKEHIEKAPLFLREDAKKLREFIKHHIRHGDKNNILYRIDKGKIIPSKNLADSLASMLNGNDEFTLLDTQKIVFETARRLARESSEANKQVLIVQGGPGTGKSVVAINLLVEFTKSKLVTQYITRNSAPRLVYEAKLIGSLKKTEISNLFSGSGSFHSVEANTYGALIVDEAHRLNKKSGMFSHLGENQIMEIINAAELSVFFIDEDQKVTIKDVGDSEEIRNQASALGAKVTEIELESQFRCNGSDAYLAWLDDVLQIRNTANLDMTEINYDFQVFDDPAKLHGFIKEKNQINNKSRLVAGYCWEWVSKRNPEQYDIIIDDYKARWNLNEHGQTWIIHPESVAEVGCIHTTQGLEVDYVGVIIGPDLIVRNGNVITQPEERAKTDKSILGWKKKMKEDPDGTTKHLDLIIKNTYRTLMTRGMKGCYIYCTDSETARYFRERLKI